VDQKETRWRQRFDNLLKAHDLLAAAARRTDLSRLEQEGLVQRFEYTFELSWKTLKDYLEAQGLPVTYPRDVIKQAFRNELLTSGETWLDMLESRNTLAHTYDETRFQTSINKVHNEFFPAIDQLVKRLNAEVDNESS